MKATHSQLAGELGSVREVISRISKDFDTNRLIKLELNQIQIIDQEALTIIT